MPNLEDASSPAPGTVGLRAARADDAASIAEIWHQGWYGGHLGHVPPALLPHRRLTDFQQRVPARLAQTTVATIDDHVVGFVTVHDDEIEQVYVAAHARGRGVADALLRHGEQAIAAGYGIAWLAVVAGNARAALLGPERMERRRTDRLRRRGAHRNHPGALPAV